MPARHHIAALAAALALASPSAALAQSGAGDSQYQDPFATPTTSTSAPQPAAADDGVTVRETPPPAAQSVTDHGVDVLPIALAAGLVLVLGGLAVAVRRRPHAQK